MLKSVFTLPSKNGSSHWKPSWLKAALVKRWVMAAEPSWLRKLWKLFGRIAAGIWSSFTFSAPDATSAAACADERGR